MLFVKLQKQKKHKKMCSKEINPHLKKQKQSDVKENFPDYSINK